jgi:hypothetical protein
MKLPTLWRAPKPEPQPKKHAEWHDPRNPHPVPLAMQAPVDPDPALIRQAFAQLMHEAHRNAVSKGFWANKTPESHAGEKVALMHSELSEALEAIRVGRWSAAPRPATAKETEQGGVKEVLEEGADAELADVLIRVFDFCAAAKLDLTGALLAKLEKNRDRAHMHGKRF